MKNTLREQLVAHPVRNWFSLGDIDPAATNGMTKAKAARDLEKEAARLGELQERLYAEGKRSLLLVLQGTDTSGKDGTVSHVIRAMNPQGCRITSFKEPTAEERRHNFLWRIRRALPPPRYVGVFNRSHYEEVGIVRVHDLVPPRVWRTRYETINNFEREVARRGTTIVKVFLHISFEEQSRRLLARLDDPSKRWKFDAKDVAERDYWSDYVAAYDDAIAKCSTNVAPWYVVPADNKWYRNWAVARLLIETLKELDPQYPEPKLPIKKLKARIKSQRPAARA
ncbi:MAG TPA: PPK2 family polyphosphate kinase [Actinomycetota bacterium]|nr:PPK2 family polyphosphate kinase [Actinomycetota bacterium]